MHDCMKLLISGVLDNIHVHYTQLRHVPIMVRSSMEPLFNKPVTSNRLKSLTTILVMYYGNMIRIPGQRTL